MIIKSHFIQIWIKLCHQKVISAVSIAGTALAIFLIMLVVMMQQVRVAPFAPESNRKRFLHVKFISVINGSWSGNAPMSIKIADECFKSLRTPEAVTAYTFKVESTPIGLPKQSTVNIDLLQTDDAFWSVFDFSFVAGKPYDEAMFNSGLPVAVVTESTAKTLFHTTDVVGRELLLNHVPYKVVGVVRDVSTLATTAYGQVWIPYTSTEITKDIWGEEIMGWMSCTILARDGDDFDVIREEVERRRQEYNKHMLADGSELVYRGRPYDQEKNSIAFSASKEPDIGQVRRQRLIVFVILLLVPAINLSSMTQSRLRQRVSEIGVRRAFGSTRLELMGQIIAENFWVTLIAGILGLLLSVAFAYWGNSLLFALEFSPTSVPPMVDAGILLHASTFFYALLFCFILNLLSSGLPAWRASRVGIVNALNGRLH